MNCLKKTTLYTYTFCGQKRHFNVEKGGDTKLMGNWALQSKLLPVLIFFFGLIFRIPETSSNIIHYPQFTV